MLVMQRPTVEQVADQEGNRQRFAIGPLEPGFGHTLGNSLRRTLLSSIPGAAITQLRFDDALHEFDTIAGVTEDVTDVILNLKDLVLVCESEEPVTLRIDVRGPADLSAADISPNADVEILNPDLHIATLNKTARLALDVVVAKGRGYVSADRNKASATIGVIPVDSIFSPVRRVAFTVEPTRVEQSTEFDRLILDIETDGSITPRDALASAGDTLRSLMSLVADMSEDPQGLELGEVATAVTGSPDLDLPIEDLDLSERPRNCLKRGAGQHDRRAAPEDRGRSAGDHELRPEVPRRGHRQARRARLVAAGRRTEDRAMPATPRKGRRFGGDAAHQRLMMANLAASLFAAEGIVTTEAKAKALRPIAEKLITKAKKADASKELLVHNVRQVVSYLGDKEMAHKLFTEIAPALRGAQRRLHPHPQARHPAGRCRTDGEDRARLGRPCGDPV